MWAWFFGGYAAFVAVLIGTAVFVALFGSDKAQRAAGYHVLKLIWVTASGAASIAAIALRLAEFGLV